MARKNRKQRHLFEEILEVLNNTPGKAWNYKQLGAALGITDQDERQALVVLLDDFTKKGLAEEVERGKFRSKTSSRIVAGRIDMTQSGAAYLIPEDGGDDVFIAARFTNGSFHGDVVKAKVFNRKRGDGREEGEVIDIVTRARTEFVGTLHIEARVAFFVPDNRKLPDFLIPKDKIGKATEGQKVIVKLTSWDDPSDLPHGEVTSVLGMPGDNNTEMNAIMVEYGLPWKFPADVEKIADRIPTEITEAEIARRQDFRKITTFTIDPVDAKDFDDALSVRKLENGHWEVGVHIADVSHYMKPGTIIDKEAVERATSVYLVDRVVPMLPEILSNFVCSLRPNEDKLTFSAVFELDENAKIHNEWFGRTIIHSVRRYAYEEVQEILEGKPGDYREELLLLDKLAKQLRDERMKNGSITFDREEVKFHLDADGNPTGVYFKVMKDSNQLIEDFMLLANRRVAEYVTLRRKAGDTAEKSKKIVHDLRRPYVYRVHPAPDPQRVKEFSDFVGTFGYKLQTGNEQMISRSLNKLLADVKDKPEANMIETLAIRSMAKAIYTTDNVGHYGLGFKYYTHFTSPIRRYPDVLAHRLLQFYLDTDAGRKSEESLLEQNELEHLCKHSSDREKVAAEAERASIKYKQVQFLQDKIGGLFDGIISGVTEFGFFVELSESKCEGMVHIRTLTDDRYFFEQERYCMRGLKTGKTFSLGDKVRIIVKTADLVKKQLDFELAGMPAKPSGGSGSGFRITGDWDETKPRKSGGKNDKGNRPKSGKGKTGGKRR
ncbi:MAG: ribonuclease R [Bacteroidota bacterium]|jgi:ribonuclease R